MEIGCHLSVAKGYAAMLNVAEGIGANTFQFFTRNPRGGRAKAIDPQDLKEFTDQLKKGEWGTLIAHAPYTLNLCSKTEETRAFGRSMFLDDLNRLMNFPPLYYNFHPGSHTGQGMEVGIQQIIEALNKMPLAEFPGWVLLEAMSGKGSEVGSRFEELQAIIDGVVDNERLGVLMDTCHVYSAGYDIMNDLDGVLDEFDRTVGLDRLKAIHLNDSLTPFDSHKDRHAKLGQGSMNVEGLIRFVSHPVISSLPLILETPNELPGYKKEIAWVRQEGE
ncbi:deoxyribonuclease IV [Gottschalkiaceae bacterium SANA]|nr:deoxyribonuclease IV [Gottschalkiaceae bacterium SANA]